MAAGGNFDLNTPKVRPGVYINFKAQRRYSAKTSVRGVCVVPLVGYDWGPDGEYVEISQSSPESAYAQLGRSVYSDNEHTSLVRLALENSETVLVYIIAGGTAATGKEGSLTVTAAYKGTRGNKITVTSVADPVAGYDVSVYLDGELVEENDGVSTIEDLISIGSSYVVFSGTGDLTAFAGLNLTGGTATTTSNNAFATFLDSLDRKKCNTVLIPVTEASLQAAAATKVKSLRKKSGKTVQFVFANYNSGDDIGIINVVNSFVFDGQKMTVAQAAAWFAGATAGADKTTSLTNKTVDGATDLIGELTNEAAEDAIKAGKVFFSRSDGDEIVVEYDINSLVNLSSDQDESYKKNRVVRVMDSFADDLKTNLAPNQFSNNEEDWAIMEGLGVALLKSYQADGAIQNVDEESDFLVDQSRSTGDSTYFNIGLEPVDSAEKLYFSVNTQ